MPDQEHSIFKYDVEGLAEITKAQNELVKLGRAHAKLAGNLSAFNKRTSSSTVSITNWNKAGEKVTITQEKIGRKLVSQQVHIDKTVNKVRELGRAYDKTAAKGDNLSAVKSPVLTTAPQVATAAPQVSTSQLTSLSEAEKYLAVLRDTPSAFKGVLTGQQQLNIETKRYADLLKTFPQLTNVLNPAAYSSIISSQQNLNIHAKTYSTLLKQFPALHSQYYNSAQAYSKSAALVQKLGIDIRKLNTTQREFIAITTKLNTAGKGYDFIKTKINGIERAAVAANLATRKLVDINAALGGSATPRANVSSKAIQSTSRLAKVQGQLNTSTRAYLGMAITQKLNNISKGFNTAAKSGERFRVTLHGLVSRVIIGSLIARAIGQITNAFSEGVREVEEYTQRIGEVRTISQNAQLSTQRWTESLRELSDAFAFPLLDTIEGAYQAISNQIAEGAETTAFLAEAQRFALISVSSTADAVNLLTGALNSYSLGAEEARRVSDIFFKTIELGRVRASEISTTFGRVGIIGNQLGISIEELGAAISTLTSQGVGASEGMTFLRNVLLKLIRPTTAMQEVFAEWGVTSGQAAIATFGFEGVLRKLAARAESAKDPLNEIGELFGRIRAIVGATGLATGSAFDTFAGLI